MAALLAGLPVEVPGVTVNRLCASGLEAVNQASRALRLGEGDLYLAGGAESMSRAPWVVPKPDAGLPRGAADDARHLARLAPRQPADGRALLDRVDGRDRRERRRALRDRPRGAGPVRAAEPPAGGRRGARRAGSPTRSSPVEAPSAERRDGPVTVDADEGPRADTSLEKLARLRPAFREGGTVTAGNASTLNDGAACLVLATAERAEALGARPARPHRLDRRRRRRPRLHGHRARCRRSGGRSTAPGSTLDDIDLIEINEAFASQVLACAGELGIDEERLNVNGGAIALGHPLGCSGARLLTTLVWELRRRGARYGIAALCVGVGQGVATVVENPEAD